MTQTPRIAARRAKLRPAVVLGIKLAVSAGLLIWLLRRIGLDSLLTVMAGAAPAPLMAGALLLLGSHLLGSWQWGRLLHLAGINLGWRRVMTFYFAGACGNLVLPTGAGGDLARIVGAGREGGGRSAAAGATLIDRLIGLGVLGTIGLFALIGARDLTGSGPGRAALAAAGVNAALSVAGLAIVMSPAGGFMLRAAGRWLPTRFGARLDRFETALGRVRRGRGLWSVFLAALAVQVTRIIAHAQVARALDIDLSLRYFFLFVPLLAVAVAVPVSIGGIGVRESMGAVLFGLLGVNPAAASAMQLLAYVLAVAVSVPGVLILLGSGGRRQPVGAELDGGLPEENAAELPAARQRPPLTGREPR